MFTAFQIFRAKMPFTPTAAAAFSFSLLLQDKEGERTERAKNQNNFSRYLNQKFIVLYVL